WRLAAAAARLEGGRRTAGSDLRLHLPPLAVELTAPRLAPLAASLEAAARIDRAGGLLVDRAVLDAGDLGRASLNGRLAPATRASLSFAGGALAAWLDLLGPLAGTPPAGYDVAGDLAAELALRRDDGEPWRATGRIAVAGGGLRSADGSRVVEGLAAGGTLELTAGDGALGLALRGQGGGFVLLWDTLFADYSDRHAGFELAVERPAGRPWQAGARLTSPAGAVLDASLAGGDDGAAAYRLALRLDDLAAVLDEDLRAPLQGSVPAVDQLLVRGRLEAELAGSWSAGAGSARGLLRLSDAGAAFAELDAAGLALELPLDLTWRKGPGDAILLAGDERRGSLRFARLRAAGVAFAPLAGELVVAGDAIRLEDDVEAPLLGGTIGLERLALLDLLRPTRRLVAGLRLAAIDLRQLTGALGLPPLAGRIDGHFPAIRVEGRPFGARFVVDGDGELAVFGGRVRLFDISGRDLLSRYPRLRFSADLQGLDLEQLTQTVAFGEMKGLVDGRLRDCELFRNLPVACAGRLTSRAGKGVRRTIDLRAVNNLSILGTGGAVGGGPLRRFLPHFTYDKLGVEVRIAGDHVLLRGLERRGGKELFLRGRLPFPIDVVNAQPGRTLSFRALLERLDQLEISRRPRRQGAAPKPQEHRP
ncbi:MAG: hypothetical protein D6696_13160, partial [Acidobacteria bacterium]